MPNNRPTAPVDAPRRSKREQRRSGRRRELATVRASHLVVRARLHTGPRRSSSAAAEAEEGCRPAAWRVCCVELREVRQQQCRTLRSATLRRASRPGQRLGFALRRRQFAGGCSNLASGSMPLRIASARFTRSRRAVAIAGQRLALCQRFESLHVPRLLASPPSLQRARAQASAPAAPVLPRVSCIRGSSIASSRFVARM